MDEKTLQRAGSPCGRACRRILLTCFLGALLLTGFAAAEPSAVVTSDQEIELRRAQAALLYKFYFYVRGLPSQTGDEALPFSIGILGEDPFAEYLQPLHGLNARGHPVVIRRSRAIEDMIACELVYICSSEQEQLEEILASFAGQPRILVSDIEDFVESGGTIGFVLSDGSVGFEINRRAARDSQLHLSSRLLRLAEKVVR